MVIKAVFPPGWNCPKAFCEVVLMRIFSSDSMSLLSTIVNTVLLNVPSRNATTPGTGPLKSTEERNSE